MRFYNQTGKPMAFELGGKSYTCEPWGMVEIADRFAYAVKAQGMKLGTVEVPAEQRAAERVAAQKESETQQKVNDLTRQLAESLSARSAAEEAVAAAARKTREAKAAVKELKIELAETQELLRVAEEERDAAAKQTKAALLKLEKLEADTKLEAATQQERKRGRR